MSLNTDINLLARKESALVSIKETVAREEQKLAQASEKALRAETAAAKTKSSSTRRMKANEARREHDKAVRIQKTLSTLRKKEANLSKEVQKLRTSVARGTQREQDKAIRGSKEQVRQNDKAIERVTIVVQNHEKRIVELEKPLDTISVLYLGISPQNADRLRIEEEARDIREALRMAGYPNAVNLHERWAVRQNDLLQAINEVNPSIVHFSCHGAKDGSIVIEDSVGNALNITKAVLAAVIGSASKQIRLVIFNACFSDNEADQILEYVDAVIGMADSISDVASIQFARQFYSSIGFGHDLNTSFNQACAAIALASPSESTTPNLRLRDGLDANAIFFI